MFENVILLYCTWTSVASIFTGGTTRQRTIDMNKANPPTVRKGRVNPPTVYKKDPRAGPMKTTNIDSKRRWPCKKDVHKSKLTQHVSKTQKHFRPRCDHGNVIRKDFHEDGDHGSPSCGIRHASKKPVVGRWHFSGRFKNHIWNVCFTLENRKVPGKQWHLVRSPTIRMPIRIKLGQKFQNYRDISNLWMGRTCRIWERIWTQQDLQCQRRIHIETGWLL